MPGHEAHVHSPCVLTLPWNIPTPLQPTPQMEDPQLQRRAAAALGELLFYADSQHQGTGSGSGEGGAAGGGGAGASWDLAPEAVQRLASLLQPGQDEVAQVGVGCSGWAERVFQIF